MLFDKFAADSLKFWNKYLATVKQHDLQGNVKSSGVVIYPKMALIANYGEHYVFELMGASTEFGGLKQKKHKGNNIDNYLNLFGSSFSNPLFILDGSNHGFTKLCLAHEADFKEVRDRFHFINLTPSRLCYKDGSGSILKFEKNFRSCFLDNCTILNKEDKIYRCKHIIFSAIVSRNILSHELRDFYNNCKDSKDENGNLIVCGIYTASHDESSDFIVSAQLKSTILFPGLHETTIGDFINEHPSIIKKAFNTNKYLYEPTFKWIEHDGTVEDQEINPDLLIQRPDGFYDIYDFKLAKTEKKKLTKGKRRRRRFIDYISEGVGQLANYREYFGYQLNAEFAEKKYGVRVKNPKLVLIAGNIENVDREEVLQACRPFRDVDLIDYDTLAMLLLAPEQQ